MPVMGLGRASPLVVGASSSSSSSSSRRLGHSYAFSSSAFLSSKRHFAALTTAAGGSESDRFRFRRADVARETAVRASSSDDSSSSGNNNNNNDDEDPFDMTGTVSYEAQQVEMRLGRAAMIGFFFATLGDVVTRGEGPLEQLRDEGAYVVNHINPYNLVKDALEVAGFYVEGVVIVWVCLAVVFLAAVQQGLANPVRTYSSKQRSSKGAEPDRVNVMMDSVKTAVNDTVKEQRPYELFNGRLAMLGISAAFVGDKLTGGLGPLEQFHTETGVPVIDAELFGAFFLFGVFFNVVATGVTVGSRAWKKGNSSSL